MSLKLKIIFLIRKKSQQKTLLQSRKRINKLLLHKELAELFTPLHELPSSSAQLGQLLSVTDGKNNIGNEHQTLKDLVALKLHRTISNVGQKGIVNIKNNKNHVTENMGDSLRSTRKERKVKRQ